MQVKLEQTKNLKTQTSFGMAQLTKRGQCAARKFIAELPEFADQRVYTKKNILRALLSNKKKPVSADEITDFFTLGDTQFTDKNAQFIKKQILTLTGQSRIKKFLKDEHIKASKVIPSNRQNCANSTTERGMALIEGIKGIFDKNINNPDVSSKKGAKILDLIRDYLGIEEHTQRAAVVKDRLYSK